MPSRLADNLSSPRRCGWSRTEAGLDPDVYVCGDGLCQMSESCGTGGAANNCAEYKLAARQEFTGILVRS